jgi:hypothetical protein
MENSKAKVSREKKGGISWSFLSFEEGVFQVEGQNGPLEYILPGLKVLGVGATFQVTIRKGDKTVVELVNQGPNAVVATDVLSDMQIKLSANQGITATVDPSGTATAFQAQAGNVGDLVTGQAFWGAEGGGEGTFSAAEEARIDVEPPTEMVEYRYTVSSGMGGKAEFTFGDGGRAYVQESTSMTLSVVKRKEGPGRKSMVTLQSGEVRFDLGTGDFGLETEVASVTARAAVFLAEVTESYDKYSHLRGEQILVRSKKEGPSEGMVTEVKPGMGLLIRHGPDVPGVIFEVPEKIPGEMVFKVRGKTLRMPGGSRLSFGETGSTVTVSVPTPEAEFAATLPLGEALSAPSDAALHDTGDLIETQNVSP